MVDTSAAIAAQEEAAKLELRLLQIEAQEQAQVDFLSFAKYVWPEAILGEHHVKMADAFNRIADGTLKRLIVNMPPRHRLALDTLVPTTKGWKTIAEIQQGDEVFSPDGSPVLVTGKSDVYEELIYEVETDDGHVVECDGEHLWTVRFHNGGFHTYNTEQLYRRQEGEHLCTTRDGRVIFRGTQNLKDYRAPLLPVNYAVKYPTQDLLVDPYVLGVWLGDGSSAQTVITSHDNDSPFVRAEIEKRGYQTSDQATKMTFGILGLKVQLRELGVLGNKHIPDQYLIGDIDQRMDLLRGLMDTDGCVSKKGQCKFFQKNLSFILSVKELLNSLGIKNYLTSHRARIGDKDYGDHYVLSFYKKDCALLPRKAERSFDPAPKNHARTIRIKKTDRKAPVQCLQVANEDGLFLAGKGYAVTHNTKSEFSSYLLPAFIMGKKPKTKIIQATHTGELAVRFGRKVRNLMDGEEYKQVFPNVALRADSKAAGRWDTDHGGEYFACLRLYAKVHTTRGLVPAGEIKVGDRLLNCGKPVTVKEIYHTSHKATVHIAGLDCSLEHPIWTMNRGWIYAKDIIDSDILCTESIWDIMKALLRRAYGYLEYTDVSPLVQHQVSMHQSKQREVGKLRGTRNYIVRAMASIRQLLVGYGTPAFSSAYSGENRQRWSLFPRELSMGNAYRTGKQHSIQCNDQWNNHGRTRQDAWTNAGSYRLSTEERTGSTGSLQVQEEELRTYGNPESIGWFRRSASFILSRGFQTVPKTDVFTKGYLASIGKTAQNLCGLLLGVRRVGYISRTEHQDISFVNFLTDGDHTFFADGVLTHNCGVGGAMTGRGADLLIIDDPHSEQDALSELAMDNAWDWYTSGPRQRLQPGGAVVVVMTRWNTKDLTARLVKAQSSHKADRWEIIEFPAILPSGNPLWPGFWKLEELLAVKASLSPQKWQAQWQQQPTNDEGAILKRDWWKIWPSEEPPPVEYIIQSYDTAYSKKETADFSAITTWGVFYPDMDSGPNIILLDVTKGRWDFPELKRIAKEQHDQWQPDNVLIEAKATGITLQQELRRMGIPVTMYSPGGRRAGQDKVSRAHSIAPMLEAGMVWAPDTDWAEDLVEECAAFPNGDNDDLVDSTVQALMRFRAGNFISLATDDQDDGEQQEVAFEYY